MEAWIVWCIVFGMACVMMFLGIMIMDLRQELKVVKGEADRWHKRAREHGWKPYWEAVQESLDSMNRNFAKIAESGKALRRSGDQMKDNAAMLDGVNAQIRDINSQNCESVAGLDRAAETMGSVREGAIALVDVWSKIAEQTTMEESEPLACAKASDSMCGTTQSGDEIDAKLASGKMWPEDVH